jgi:hypothetical protein
MIDLNSLKDNKWLGSSNRNYKRQGVRDCLIRELPDLILKAVVLASKR